MQKLFCFFSPGKMFFRKNSFLRISGVIGLKPKHELLQISLSRPAREKMVVDPVE